MSDEKKKGGISPWMVTVLMGMLTMLFAFYAFQQQESANDVEDKMQQMEVRHREELQRANESERKSAAMAAKLKERLDSLQLKLDAASKRKK